MTPIEPGISYAFTIETGVSHSAEAFGNANPGKWRFIVLEGELPDDVGAEQAAALAARAPR